MELYSEKSELLPDKKAKHKSIKAAQKKLKGIFLCSTKDETELEPVCSTQWKEEPTSSTSGSFDDESTTDGRELTKKSENVKLIMKRIGSWLYEGFITASQANLYHSGYNKLANL